MNQLTSNVLRERHLLRPVCRLDVVSGQRSGHWLTILFQGQGMGTPPAHRCTPAPLRGEAGEDPCSLAGPAGLARLVPMDETRSFD